MHAKKTSVRSNLLALLAMLILALSSAASPLQQDPPPNQSPVIEHYQNWAEPPRNMQKHSDMPSAEVVDPNYTAPPGPDPDAKNRMVYENYVVTNGSYDLFYAIVDGVDFDRITNTPADEYYPRFDGTAKRIVFVSNELGSADIFNSSYWGADKKAVVVSPAVDTMPAFSNDGSKIAFVSDRTGSAEIFVCGADGGGLAQLTAAVEPDVEPDWTKDGTKIVWVRRAGSSGTLMVMNANGSSQHAISAPLPYAGRPRWSPNGKMIAFQLDANGDGWMDLATIKADGSQLTVFLVGQGIDYPLEYWMGGWSSSGDKIFFSMVRYNFYDGQWWINESHIYSLIQKTLVWYPIVYSTGSVYSFNPDLQAYDQTAPEVALQPLAEFTQASQVKVPFHLYDSSGVYAWWFETRGSPLAEWLYSQPVITGSCGTSGCEAMATFSGIPGTSINIRLRAYDKSGNLTPDNPAKEVSTKMYLRNLTAQVMDVREQNLADVLVSLIPAAMNAPSTTDGQGQASLYTAVDGDLTALYAKTGYGSLPGQTVPVYADRSFNAVIPPYDDVVVNGQFEDGSGFLTSWTTSGTLSVNSIQGTSGEYGVRLGNRCSDLLCLSAFTPLEDLTQYQEIVAHFGVDKDGQMNLITPNKHWILGTDGVWQVASDLLPGRYGELLKDPSGRLFTWRETPQVSKAVLQKADGVGWIEIPTPYWPYKVDIDASGKIHMLHYKTGQAGLFYSSLEPGGSWSTPLQLSTFNIGQPNIAAESDGTVYFAFSTSSNAYRRKLSADGILSPLENLGSGGVEFFRTSDGTLNFLYCGRWVKLLPDGAWSPPIFLSPAGCGSLVGKVYDPDGNIHRISRCSPSLTDYQYIVYLAGQGTPLVYPFTSSNIGRVEMGIDPKGALHFIGASLIDATTTRLFHNQMNLDATDQRVDIHQPVTVPQSALSPTLSFFTRLNSFTPAPEANLWVTFTPEGENPILLHEQTEVTNNWKHVWIDLASLKGQTGQLSFQLNQPKGEAWATVELDEISLGSWSTPSISSITPVIIPYPVADTWLTVWGSNFHPDAQVLVRGVPAAQIEWMSENELRFVPPGSLGLGFHPVDIINPGGANARSQVHLGSPGFIPLIRR